MVMLVIGASREVPLSSIHMESWIKLHHVYIGQLFPLLWGQRSQFLREENVIKSGSDANKQIAWLLGSSNHMISASQNQVKGVKVEGSMCINEHSHDVAGRDVSGIL